MRRELLSVLDEIEADPTSRVAILTGAGGHFCSGGDVKTMRTRHTAAEGRGRVEMLNRLVLRLVDYPLPTIAMVDGYAVGAGSNLALCCDLIIASDRAKFGELFCKMAWPWTAAARGCCRAWSGWRGPRSSSSRATSSTPP